MQRSATTSLGFFLLVQLLALVAFVEAAHACQTCATGDPTFAVSSSETGGSQHVFSAAFQQSLRLEVYGENDRFEFTEWRSDLALGYAYGRGSVALRLPWVVRSLDADGLELARVSAFGDVEVLGGFRFLQRGDEQASGWLALNLGLSLPTGREFRDGQGTPLVDDVQPGAGSVIPIVGLSGIYRRGITTLDGRVTGYLPLASRFNFRIGNTLQARARATFEVVGPLTLGVAAFVQAMEPVEVMGEAEEDTGGVLGTLDGEVGVQLYDGLLLSVAVRVPVIQGLLGDHRARVGGWAALQWSGRLREERQSVDPNEGRTLIVQRPMSERF